MGNDLKKDMENEMKETNTCVVNEEHLTKHIGANKMIFFMEDFLKNDCYEGKAYPNKEADEIIRRKCKKSVIKEHQDSVNAIIKKNKKTLKRRNFRPFIKDVKAKFEEIYNAKQKEIEQAAKLEEIKKSKKIEELELSELESKEMEEYEDRVLKRTFAINKIILTRQDFADFGKNANQIYPNKKSYERIRRKCKKMSIKEHQDDINARIKRNKKVLTRGDFRPFIKHVKAQFYKVYDEKNKELNVV